MNTKESIFTRGAAWLTFGSAVAILLSIAASQILLGLALAALLLSGDAIRLPRIRLALGLFLAGTVVALLFSGEIAHGLPQIRKFFVFTELLVVFSCLRDAVLIRWLFLAWAGVGSIDALRGFVQFAAKMQQAHSQGLSVYQYYVNERITGFTSHWNTYSAEEMFAFIMICAFLFFSPGARRRSWVWVLCAALMAVAILLAETRGVYAAVGVAAGYLLWFWNRKLVLVLPVLAGVTILVSPPVIRERFSSFLKPKQEDSNTFRKIAWRSGIRMIEAHPLLGIGPDGPKYHFMEYLPEDVPRASLPSGFYEHIHNLYLQYAAERGIPVLLIFLWMIAQILIDFFRGLRSLPPGRSDKRFLLHGGIAVVLAVLVEAFVEVNLGDSEVLTMFLVVVGCGYLALEKEIAFNEPLPTQGSAN
ncbi:MAG: O-antigen ligase family protein [Candidatus Sulfopaludibacter sp.]|nr:O-antigen ligase family protein [Candidatus Sulfopaludibacter sp.]